MNSISIKGTEDTPTVIFDTTNGIFELSGRSLPEDAAGFYAPVLRWLEINLTEIKGPIKLYLKLEYFNTASSKLLLDVLLKVLTIKGSSITWYHFEDDEDMLEAGEELSELVEVPFDFKTF